MRMRMVALARVVTQDVLRMCAQTHTSGTETTGRGVEFKHHAYVLSPCRSMLKGEFATFGLRRNVHPDWSTGATVKEPG